MSLRKFSGLVKFARPSVHRLRYLQERGKATVVVDEPHTIVYPVISSVIPAPHLTAKIYFENNQTADFKYIWLRDNCRCEKCVDANSKQKIMDTPSIDVNLRPKSLLVNSDGELEVKWVEPGGTHMSRFDPKWLYKYGQSFIHNSFETDTADKEDISLRPDICLWNRSDIWSNFPELSYNEFMDSEEGLRVWMEMFYKYGVSLLRGVPIEERKIVDVAKRIAYVKETQYGLVFDVINKPEKEVHLAFTGLPLAHHTDMNYREKSPGMQMLHCLKAKDPKLTGSDPGGKSFFVDGFKVAKWLEENEPAAFHVLTSTPVRFSIRNDGQRYSAVWQVICTNSDGDVCEIHYNNRTMQPLQAPTHVITPFYHAYKLFSQKLREASNCFEIQMLPGDLVAFNNRRVLHGRTAFDTTTVSRHLQGCYVDIDEAFSKLDWLQSKKAETQQTT